MGGTEDPGGRPSAGPQDPTWGPHGLKCGWDLGLASDQLKTAKGVGCHFCGNIMQDVAFLLPTPAGFGEASSRIRVAHVPGR